MKKKILLGVVIIVLIVFIILVRTYMDNNQSAKINDSKNNEEIAENSAPAIIRYNDNNYRLHKTIRGVDVSTLEPLGQITSTVDLSELPIKNFETNYNYMGHELYKYDEDTLLVEYPKDSYNLFWLETENMTKKNDGRMIYIQYDLTYPNIFL